MNRYPLSWPEGWRRTPPSCRKRARFVKPGSVSGAGSWTPQRSLTISEGINRVLLEAMRSIERHGGAVILDRAFAGFAALPAPGGTSRTWWRVMGFDAEPGALDQVRARYRSLASTLHPDRGGSSESMAELNGAWTQAQKQLGVTQ